MTATLTQARDEILTQFRTAWLADPASAALPVLWPDSDSKPPASGAWARVSVTHGSGGQSTLSGGLGETRYTHMGFVTVQLFTPRGDGLKLSDQLVTISKHAFEGVATSPGHVTFYRVRSREVGPDGQWFNTNVLADFEYDEVR
jgi:hypothetical protein